MFKFKNILKAFAIVTLASSVVTIAASCQISTRYDQDAYFSKDNEGKKIEKIRIITNFGPSSDQKRYNALNSIIDKYNEFLDENKDNSEWNDALKVEANYNFGLTYNDVYNNLKLKISSKDRQTIGNLVLNYPSTAVFLGSYNMILNLDDVDTHLVNQSTINSYRILGLDNSKKWILPFGQSSEILSVNKLLLGYILNALNSKYSKKHTDTLISNKNSALLNESLQQFNQQNPESKKYLENLWKLKDVTDIDFSQYENTKLDDSIISTYDGMLEFSYFIAKLLNSINNSNQLFTLGMDNPVNEIFMQMYNKASNNFDNFYLKPLKSKQYILNYYENIQNSQNNEFIELLNKYVDLANTGRFYTQFDSETDFNSTTLQTQHIMLFSISSSLAYNYVKYVPESYSYKNQTISYLGIGDWTNNEAHIGANTFLYTLEVDNNNKFTKWLNKKDNSKNSVFLTNQNINEIKAFSENLSQLKILHNSTAANELFLKNKQDFQKIYLTNNIPNVSEIKLVNDILTKLPSVTNLEEIHNLEQKLPNTYIGYWLLKNFQKIDKNLKPQITPNEVITTSVPLKNNANDTNRGTFIVQGPSIIGIHANKKADKATLKFLKWLYSDYKITVKAAENLSLQLTPVETFAFLSGYLFPSSNFVSEYKKTSPNPFLNTFLDNLQKSQEINGAVPYQDIADLNSNSFRDAVSSALNLAIKSGQTNQKITIDKVIEFILNAIHSFSRE
ncbi:P68 family surface lipoprotein [Mycoplasma miroungirhinis]|uniref:P80 family lipoprotein n=1 Tax=Mycoplasma miroungirhinis TaxID=754516 RepID=A0A6M4JIC3_9MOLU|nr:P80 family lipoprotein [Mycoplasma miroungirhinis]QJR44221.1 P80 family lipoprotein [Mycoplasma miroungirhinis]